MTAAPAVFPPLGDRINLTKSIDLRSVALRERRQLLFSAFDGMPDGGVLHVISEDDLRPLRHEFERLRTARTAWMQTKRDGVHWESFIRRVEVPTAPASVEAALKRTWLLERTSIEQVAALAMSARSATMARGHVTVEQGLPFPYLGLVISGFVQASVTAPDGKEIWLCDRLAGDVYGESGLLAGGVSPVRYVARATETLVALLNAAAVREVLSTTPALMNGFALLACESNRVLIERIASLTSQPIVARLARALLSYADMREGMAAAIEPLPQFRQDELSLLAGTGRDLIFRALTQLESNGVLQRSNGRIVALNRRKLERFARLTKYEKY
jgi:CRP/FNR family transcriptional regulator, cyclic AMP receptor protein